MEHSLEGRITSHQEAHVREQFRINQGIPGTVGVVRGSGNGVQIFRCLIYSFFADFSANHLQDLPIIRIYSWIFLKYTSRGIPTK